MNLPRRHDQRHALRNMEILALAEKMPPVQIVAKLGLTRGVVLGVCYRARKKRGPRACRPVADITMWADPALRSPDRRALAFLSHGEIERRGDAWRFGTAVIGDTVMERLVASGAVCIIGDRAALASAHSSAKCGGAT